MKKKQAIRVSSFILFMTGVILLFSSQISITGAVTGTGSAGTGYFIGAVFIIVSVLMLVFFEPKKITLRDSINEYPHFEKLAKSACKDQYVKKDLENLTKQLREGNPQAGIGRRHLGHNTGVSYMRGRHGGRLFYKREGDNNYKIIAKSSKGNESKVIQEIYKRYSH